MRLTLPAYIFLSVCRLIWSAKLSEDVHSVAATLTNATTHQYPSAHEFKQLAERRLKASKDIYQEQLQDSVYNYLYKYERFDGQLSLAELSELAVMSNAVGRVYLELYIHNYDDLNDLRESGGPNGNQELCLHQLSELVERAHQLERDQHHSRDINLIQLLDTFGKLPAGLLSAGHTFSPGMYHQCIKLNIRLKPSPAANDLQMSSGANTSRVKVSRSRYCAVSLRHNDWYRDDAHETNGLIKRGVCLPVACDSLNYKNKFELINRLLETQTRKIDRGNFYVSDLYCLPDEQSSLRQFWRSPASLVTFLTLSGWIGLQIFATLWMRKNRQASGRSSGLEEKQSAAANDHERNSSKSESDRSCEDQLESQRRVNGTKLMLFRCLSITDNAAKLFDTSARKTSEGQAAESPNRTRIVDLSSLDGIKVIAMNYIILGHVLMCVTLSLSNPREQADSSIAYYLSNSLPAFAVNSFFTITGLLTAYLLFKRNKSVDFMSSPTNWMAVIAHRYLRIMPMYALVVIYLKTLAKYTGSGPYWDYGTTAMGPRKNCEQESLLWTLLFGANFKPVLEQCIPAAWYLANDFQFFIVTPILLTILNKSPTLGKRVLLWGMFAGYLAGVWSIFTAPTDDLRPVANFMPHGFKTYTSHLSHNYTQPQYRIPAYLFGLLIGFLLHEFEQKQLVYLSFKAKRESLDDKEESEKAQVQPADWPESIKRYGFAFCVVCVSFCVGTPIVSSRLPASKIISRLVVALVIPTLHVISSLAVGVYVLLASTGLGNPLVNRILSHPLWKPLARLSLCAVLINIEVISYIVQTSTGSFHLEFSTKFALDLLCLLSVYLMSAVICTLFEIPIRETLGQLLSQLMSRMENKRKVD